MQYKGYILYSSADVPKNQWFISHMIEKAAEKNISLSLKLTADSIPADVDFIINRSRNYSVCEFAENQKIPVFNSSHVTKIANDKDLTYREMEKISVPFLPYITVNISNPDQSSYAGILSCASAFGYPFVSKPADGHGGNHVILIKDENDLIKELDLLTENSKTSYTYNKLIFQKCAATLGKDLRVYLLAGKIVCGILRESNNDFRANFSLGGKSKVHTLSYEEQELISKINDFFPSDLIGVDLIYDGAKPIFNEIEDAVGCRMLYANTDLDIIDMYLDHIKSILDENKKP